MGKWTVLCLLLAGCSIYGDEDWQPPGDDDVEDPIARDDTLTVDEDAPQTDVTQQLLQNDDGITYFSATTQPQHGSAYLDFSGHIQYRPHPGYHGRDSFTYTAYPLGSTLTATVTIDVRSDGIPYEEGVLIDTGDFSRGVSAGDLDG